MKEKIKNLNDILINNQGIKMWVKEYRNSRDIDVEFEDGFIYKNTDIRRFRKGCLESPNHKSLFGVGYLGEGSYSHKNNQKFYLTWHSMLTRCYDEKSKLIKPTYNGCFVCEEWYNFQNFAKWCEDNYYEIEKESMCLDKDILFKGNKVYSPSTCIFVPQTINKLFTKRQNDRGEYPIGVCKASRGSGFEAWCNINKKQTYLGVFQSVEESFLCYKKAKEKEIKRIAVEYKDKIPQKLYEAMCRYEVEITD